MLRSPGQLAAALATRQAWLRPPTVPEGHDTLSPSTPVPPTGVQGVAGNPLPAARVTAEPASPTATTCRSAGS